MPIEPLIAVVDDDDSFRMALVEALGLRYRTHGFASAEDFIASEDWVSCSCVITDIHMPGMSGFELGRLLARERHGVPVLMVTARSDLGIDARAAASGAICVLRKPFKMEVLIGRLERAFSS